MKRGAGSTSVRKSSTGGWGGLGPADTEGEDATWRPGEEEEATRGIATCGASVSARPEGGGSTRVRRPTTPPRDTGSASDTHQHDRPLGAEPRRPRCPIRTGRHIFPGRWVRHTNKTHANRQKRSACRSPLTARLSQGGASCDALSRSCRKFSPPSRVARRAALRRRLARSLALAAGWQNLA